MSRNATAISLRKVKDPDTDSNFGSIYKTIAQLGHGSFTSVNAALAAMGPASRGQVTEDVVLAVGVNLIDLPIQAPVGRVTVYQSAAATITDQGIVGDQWQVTSTAVCTVRFLFL